MFTSIQMRKEKSKIFDNFCFSGFENISLRFILKQFI